jgi:hypothetical protein
MAEKTLGQVAMYAYQKRTSNDIQAWQAVADAVEAAIEARRWRPIESAPKTGEFWVGRWVILPGGRLWDLGFAMHSEYLARVWSYWCPIPAPPQEVERGA